MLATAQRDARLAAAVAEAERVRMEEEWAAADARVRAAVAACKEAGLEAEATDLAKLRDSLATAEERYAQAQQQQPERPAAEQGLEELDPAAQETPEAAALRRQRIRVELRVGAPLRRRHWPACP